eukprot:756423-Hanusia_phi.AAC.1
MKTLEPSPPPPPPLLADDESFNLDRELRELLAAAQRDAEEARKEGGEAQKQAAMLRQEALEAERRARMADIARMEAKVGTEEAIMRAQQLQGKVERMEEEKLSLQEMVKLENLRSSWRRRQLEEAREEVGEMVQTVKSLLVDFEQAIAMMRSEEKEEEDRCLQEVVKSSARCMKEQEEAKEQERLRERIAFLEQERKRDREEMQSMAAASLSYRSSMERMIGEVDQERQEVRSLRMLVERMKEEGAKLRMEQEVTLRSSGDRERWINDLQMEVCRKRLETSEFASKSIDMQFALFDCFETMKMLEEMMRFLLQACRTAAEEKRKAEEEVLRTTETTRLLQVDLHRKKSELESRQTLCRQLEEENKDLIEKCANLEATSLSDRTLLQEHVRSKSKLDNYVNMVRGLEERVRELELANEQAASQLSSSQSELSSSRRAEEKLHKELELASSAAEEERNDLLATNTQLMERLSQATQMWRKVQTQHTMVKVKDKHRKDLIRTMIVEMQERMEKELHVVSQQHNQRVRTAQALEEEAERMGTLLEEMKTTRERTRSAQGKAEEPRRRGGETATG